MSGGFDTSCGQRKVNGRSLFSTLRSQCAYIMYIPLGVEVPRDIGEGREGYVHVNIYIYIIQVYI